MDAFLLVFAYAGLLIVYAFAETAAKEFFVRRKNRHSRYISCRQKQQKDEHTNAAEPMKRSA